LALALAYNITIPDGIGQSSSQGDWYSGSHEDQEVEPGNETGQKWDLEGFFLDGSILTIVGGFNFKTGASGNGMTFSSGDIFIDVDGDATYGQSYSQAHDGYLPVSNSLFGYDYVYHLAFNKSKNEYTYTLYALDEDSILRTPYYTENSESGPYQYLSGGDKKTTGKFTVTELEDDDPLLSSLQGDTHYALSIDLADFLLDEEFTVHYTIGCGNDSLIGSYKPSSEIIPPLDAAPVPEPATVALLLTGLIGFAFRRGIRRAVNP
jgi:hypothetical protein